MNITPESRTAGSKSTALIIVIAVGIALTMWFWLDLWLGGGLIGGDVYTYYFPQKSFYAEALKLGDIPLWNSLVGHGYPLVAESQTGAFYPPNLLLYRLLDVNTAYNVNHLFHYLLAFCATVWLARDLGTSLFGALFAGLVFVYGWFAPRSCLEWAILTGAYLPLSLAMLNRYFRSRNVQWLWGLSGVLCLQLLPGHFHLAFITLICLSLWSLCEWIAEFRSTRNLNRSAVIQTENPRESEILGASDARPQPANVYRFLQFKRTLILPALAISLGILMASMQLLPTWSLKQNSQRETSSSADFDPGYGHIPPRYLSQVVIPWYWYRDPQQLDNRLNSQQFLDYPTATNPVEAHLYFGFLPFFLAILGGVSIVRSHSDNDRRLLWLGGVGLLAVIYATGWLLPLLQNFPGFSFFRGPGRYGIVASLAAALWAARGWETIRDSIGSRWQVLLAIVISVITLLDLSWVSQRITYAFMVPETPMTRIVESPVRQQLIALPAPARIFGPGPNLLTITGFSATPVYLGIGPAEYFNPDLSYPESPSDSSESLWATFTSKQIEWMQRAGVTHIVSYLPPDPQNAFMKLEWQGIDPLLNGAWGRFQEPIYLSRLLGSRGRISWSENSESTSIDWVLHSSEKIELHVETPIDQMLILTELYDSDWIATIDGQPATSRRIEGMYRGLDIPAGSHRITWNYRSGSFRWGLIISIAGFTIWLMIGISLVIWQAKPQALS
ncbi:YfhO family protein [uncultured Rubinisphaera sp.]|uniref:YfhO family protein n=1 Tax=uncultured Rubinisphaera sp. TaxID=1678686 RepID=UPI0030DB8306